MTDFKERARRLSDRLREMAGKQPFGDASPDEPMMPAIFWPERWLEAELRAAADEADANATEWVGMKVDGAEQRGFAAGLAAADERLTVSEASNRPDEHKRVVRQCRESIGSLTLPDGQKALDALRKQWLQRLCAAYDEAQQDGLDANAAWDCVREAMKEL